MYPYQSTAEDIRLLNAWWHSPPSGPFRAVVRSTSVVIRRLILDNEIRRAWKHFGCDGAPTILAPDLLAFVQQRPELELEYTAKALAGGGNINGVHYALNGLYRIDNATTGVPAGAPSGFAVQSSVVARLVVADPPSSPLDRFVNHAWTPEEFASSASIVVNGEVFTRGEVIRYWAHYCGTAHYDRESPPADKEKKYSQYLRHQAIEKLEGHFTFKVTRDDASNQHKLVLSSSYDSADTSLQENTILVEGLLFELLSIGQAIGRSPDMLTLAATIERNGSQ